MKNMLHTLPIALRHRRTRMLSRRYLGLPANCPQNNDMGSDLLLSLLQWNLDIEWFQLPVEIKTNWKQMPLIHNSISQWWLKWQRQRLPKWIKFESNMVFTLTTEILSLETRQNVICFPVKTVCSTRRVNNGAVHGNWFKWAINDRSWSSTGSDMMSLSMKMRK